MSMLESPAEKPSSSTADLWADFTAAGDEQDYYQSWLALQSGLIQGVVQSLLIVADDEQKFTPVASWPAGATEPQRLADIVERVLDEQCGLLVELQASSTCAIAYPLLVDDQLQAVAALEISADHETALQAAMEQLQWGVSWLEVFCRRQRASEAAATLKRLQAAVDLLAATLGEDGFSAAGMAFVTELAALSQCDRVSLGFLRGRHIRVEAVSHSADVGQKMNLTRAIGLAMDEAVLQRQELLFPPADGSDVLICREHENLSRQQQNAQIVSIPFYGQGRYYGALCCERPADHPFTAPELEFFRAVAALVGPALEAKELNDRSLPVKIKDAGKSQLGRLFGPRYLGRKLLLLLLAGLVIFFSLFEADYRLAADTTLEGEVRRAVVAPFDGYIDQALARAGDRVEAGALLCALDERDLRLEKLARVSQGNQLQKQYQEAQARHDRAQASIIRAQLEQSQAELQLIEAKLNRARLTAPFAGLLVGGDLSQRLGGAVEKGEVLFEITPLDAYRVILQVDERRIGDVAIGQQGRLVLSSLPDQKFAFTVSKITPITQAEDGRNFFRVEAQLATVADSLRPGMEGVGKVSVDRRLLIEIWTRDLVEWLQLWSWRWLP